MILQIFRSFRKIIEVFGHVGTNTDPLGPVWKHSGTSGCIRMHSDASGRLRENRIVLTNFGYFCLILTKQEVVFLRYP